LKQNKNLDFDTFQHYTVKCMYILNLFRLILVFISIIQSKAFNSIIGTIKCQSSN